MQYRRAFSFIILLTIITFVISACDSQDSTPVETEVPVVDATEEVVDDGSFPEGTQIKLLQWNHFVPQYDKWFDPFIEDWGDSVWS